MSVYENENTVKKTVEKVFTFFIRMNLVFFAYFQTKKNYQKKVISVLWPFFFFFFLSSVVPQVQDPGSRVQNLNMLRVYVLCTVCAYYTGKY